MYDYTATGSEESEPLWTCIGCLGRAPRSVVNENDGLCGECAEGEWPRRLEQVP